MLAWATAAVTMAASEPRQTCAGSRGQEPIITAADDERDAGDSRGGEGGSQRDSGRSLAKESGDREGQTDDKETRDGARDECVCDDIAGRSGHVPSCVVSFPLSYVCRRHQCLSRCPLSLSRCAAAENVDNESRAEKERERATCRSASTLTASHREREKKRGKKLWL